jgi:hypothetical protein
MSDAGTPSYPIYVLIWDDKSFKKVLDSAGLRYFEEMDLREGPHIAWDQLGREYIVRWDSNLRQPVLTLKAELGRNALRHAIADYRHRLSMHGMTLPPHGRCDPDSLSAFLSTIKSRKR